MQSLQAMYDETSDLIKHWEKNN